MAKSSSWRFSRLRGSSGVYGLSHEAMNMTSASAISGGHGYVLAFGRPLSLGRDGGVAVAGRVSSLPHCGRRIASADFHSTGVASSSGGFVSRFHRGSSALAPARSACALHVQPRGPTRRSTPVPSVTGRCAMKPRSAGHLARYTPLAHLCVNRGSPSPGPRPTVCLSPCR